MMEQLNFINIWYWWLFITIQIIFHAFSLILLFKKTAHKLLLLFFGFLVPTFMVAAQIIFISFSAFLISAFLYLTVYFIAILKLLITLDKRLSLSSKADDE
ncbi:MAG: hypothetical protein MJA84_11500 [Firmicutes bacterium]|nr:hypothetical protein [Bacillota bacterium]